MPESFLSPEPWRDPDWSEGILPNVCRDDWEYSPEVEMVMMASDLPAVRPSLRTEFLSELHSISDRRERIRRVPVVLACLVAAFVGFFGWRLQETDSAAIARADVRRSALDGFAPSAIEPDLSGYVLPDRHAAVHEAVRNEDAWQVVEAFDDLRHGQRVSLTTSFAAE